MENWLEKYKPKTLSEIIGNKEGIEYINKFIKQFTKKKINIDKINTPNIIISGTNGVGKNLVTDLVLKENGLEKIISDLSNISVARKTKRKKKNDKEVIGTNRSVKTYYMSLHNNRNILPNGDYIERRIALVFDNVSNISNAKEKEAIKAIVKINNKLKKFPIIIIANNKHSKTVNELRKMASYKKKSNNKKKKEKKVVNEVVLKPPQYDEIEQFVKNICKNEKINIVCNRSANDDDIYEEIINHAQYDMRRLVNILDELKQMYQNNEITIDKFEKFQETSKKKDIDPGIYQATSLLLDGYKNINYALSVYGEERATIPLMVHENYPLNIWKQYPKLSVDSYVDMLYNISSCISESDKIDGLIYSNQCWNLQPVHGFYSCVMPSYYINRVPKKLHTALKYEYTQDYNKTSIKKINNKVIKKAQENQLLKKVTIYDFLYIASILKILFERKEFEKVAELMRPYGLKLKEIESIIKIDKIKKSKTTLTGKQKTLLKEILGVTE